MRWKDYQTAMKVLVAKTFRFVESIWDTYVAHNKVDVR